jgi:hypothetical protein
MPQSILIIGEAPELIDFSAPGMPPDMNAQTIMEGVCAATNRLEGMGHEVGLLLTKDAETVEGLVSAALKERDYDVIVIGAGLRTLPPMLEQFEKLINVLREKAPRAKVAFNSRPEDSDKAALRGLAA